MVSSSIPSVTCNVSLPGPSLADICNASAFVVFMTLLEEMINKNEIISGRCERVKPVETLNYEYDIVVIGSGAGGSVVAGRLSEIPDLKILLLEAGPDEPAVTKIPAFYGLLLGSAVDWNYATSNESYACLAMNGSCPWPAGKMLGGSTAHFGTKYIRGVPKDYDNWAAKGNEGWTWEEVEPFFLRAEDNNNIEKFGRIHHATGGPLSVEQLPHLPPFADSILAASIEAGYGVSKDLNGDNITGFAVVQTTTKHGVKRSSAAAYLWPARDRENLHVSLNSLATKVLIKNGKAIGVEYYKNGEYKRVGVSKEVIISAGAVGSPKILLQSGIGPKEHLNSVEIETVKDLPGVGENLHDHVSTTIHFTINDEDIYDNNRVVLAEYLANQTGPLSGIGLSQVQAAFASSATTPDFPDIQIYFKGYAPGCATGEINALHSTGRRTVIVRVVNLHPSSRGTLMNRIIVFQSLKSDEIIQEPAPANLGRLTLASNDPFEKPIVWGNFLSELSDVDCLVDGIEMVLALADTKAMRKHNLTLSSTPHEACSQHTFGTPDYWACMVRQEKATEYHAAGSCKMGPSSDPMAVVDPQLRVHGIKGLRVADAAIMPEVISGNTAAPTMMIGERAADFITKDLRREKFNNRHLRTYKSP